MSPGLASRRIGVEADDGRPRHRSGRRTRSLNTGATLGSVTVQVKRVGVGERAVADGQHDRVAAGAGRTERARDDAGADELMRDAVRAGWWRSRSACHRGWHRMALASKLMTAPSASRAVGELGAEHRGHVAAR